MSSTAILVLIPLLLLAAVLTIAVWAARRTHNAQDFVLANRRLGPWLVAVSHCANANSAWLLTMTAAMAFTVGLSALWMWIAVVAACIVNVWFVAPRVRAAAIGQGAATLVQVLCADAGERMQPLLVRSAVFIALVSLLLQIAPALHLGGALLAGQFGFDPGIVAVTSIVVAALALFHGGLRAQAVSMSRRRRRCWALRCSCCCLP